MVVMGGLCMKLCDVSELLVLPVSCTLSKGVRHSFTRTNEIYVDRLEILPFDILLNGTEVLNGCNRRFVHKIMQFCCVGAAAFLAFFSKLVITVYTKLATTILLGNVRGLSENSNLIKQMLQHDSSA